MTLTPISTDDTHELGYRATTACDVARITYRQCDYWARTGLVEPSLRGAAGSGTQRLYTFRDIVLLRTVKQLLDCGVSLQSIRNAVAFLHDRTLDDLAGITLLSDGDAVFALHTADEVYQLLQGGVAVFAVSVRQTVAALDERLADLPAERAYSPLQVVS